MCIILYPSSPSPGYSAFLPPLSGPFDRAARSLLTSPNDTPPLCGRVKVEGQWSNYACVEIKP